MEKWKFKPSSTEGYLQMVAAEDFICHGKKIKDGDLGGLVEIGCSKNISENSWIDASSSVSGESFIVGSLIEKSSVKDTYIRGSRVEGVRLSDSSVKASHIAYSGAVFMEIEKRRFTGADIIGCCPLNLKEEAENSGLFLSEVAFLQWGSRFKEGGIALFNRSVGEGEITVDPGGVVFQQAWTFVWPFLAATGRGRFISSCADLEWAYGENGSFTYVEVQDTLNGLTFLFEGTGGEPLKVFCIDTATGIQEDVMSWFEKGAINERKASVYAFGKGLSIFLQGLKNASEDVRRDIEEAETLFDEYVEAAKRGEGEEDAYGKLRSSWTSLYTNLACNHPRVCGSSNILNEAAILGLSAVNQTSSEKFGTFSLISARKTRLEKAEDLSLGKEALKKKYELFPEREFSEEEKALIPEIPSHIKIDSVCLDIADRVKKSFERPPHLRKSNILLEGPKGTGKTELTKTLAGLWGIPRVSLTCSGNMTEDTLIGAVLPNLPEESSEDPFEGAVAYYGSEEGKSSPEFVFCASQLALALERGWLCEIQEPTCINDAAVLIALNSAMEKDGQLQLPSRVIKRHPDAIIVITTNRDYEGCRPLNQALRDRMDWSVAMELPEEEELCDRICAYTGCEDRGFVLQAVRGAAFINEQLLVMGLNNSVSQRGLNNFVADMMDGYDVAECIAGDLLNSITTDPEEMAELITAIENGSGLYGLRYNG